MKLVIASDIHGSALWCERLMQQVERESPDLVVLLGDVLYHGPRNPLPDGHDPARVAQMLNGIADKIVAVRGNCDSEVDQMVLDFPCLADYTIVQDGAYRLFCTHGHIWSPDNLPKIAKAAQGAPIGHAALGDSGAEAEAAWHTAFLYGHTHVKQNETVGGIRLVNPGSIALPKDSGQSYALYRDGEFELCAL